MTKRALLAAICMIHMGCSDKVQPFFLDTSGSPIDTDTEIPKDSASDSASVDTGFFSTDVESDSPDTSEPEETDTGSADSATEGDDTDSEASLGAIGVPCWKAVFGSSHPNADLPDCAYPSVCVGDNDEAWCTEVCKQTGTISANPSIEGWCCGEVGSACNSSRYFMPKSMASNCVPRVLALGAACTNDGDKRCASVCDGKETIESVVCTQTESGGFCSFGCTDNSECADYAVFESGCCGSIMGSHYCLMETSDSCL